MTENKTSSVVLRLAAFYDRKTETLEYREEELAAIAAKYQKFESYAKSQADKGDTEALKVLEFDPLA